MISLISLDSLITFHLKKRFWCSSLSWFWECFQNYNGVCESRDMIKMIQNKGLIQNKNSLFKLPKKLLNVFKKDKSFVYSSNYISEFKLLINLCYFEYYREFFVELPDPFPNLLTSKNMLLHLFLEFDYKYQL